MITTIGEDFGGVFGGKRGILSIKKLVSQPLRKNFTTSKIFTALKRA